MSRRPALRLKCRSLPTCGFRAKIGAAGLAWKRNAALVRFAASPRRRLPDRPRVLEIETGTDALDRRSGPAAPSNDRVEPAPVEIPFRPAAVCGHSSALYYSATARVKAQGR